MTEPRDVAVRRMAMRSMRRGIKEMDIILGTYADRKLSVVDDATLATYDAMLSENDHDLYAWVTGTAETPGRYLSLIDDIRATNFE